MSAPIEAGTLGELEFKWGKKRGVGGKNKDVRFYEEFTFDGMDYALYDCVYMYKEGEPAPYIGKLVKIWENNDKSKKIKVQWFFRPSEISFHIKDVELLENELFFAAGDGKGLANINPLDAIAGKCNVICISKDRRNPQPSAEELEMADYIFYRVFDVKSCTISDHMDDMVGGLEVKNVFNRGESVRTPAVPNRNLSGKEIPKVAGNGTLQQPNSEKPEGNKNHMVVKEGENAKEAQVKKESLPGDSPLGFNVNSSDIRKVKDISIVKRSILGEKYVKGEDNSEKDQSRDVKSPTGQVKMENRVKSTRNPGHLDGTQPKKARLDGTVFSSEVKDKICVGSLSGPGKDIDAPSANAKSQSELNKDLDRSVEDTILAGKCGVLDERVPKSAEISEGLEGIGQDSKLKNDLNALQVKQSKDFASTEMGKEFNENVSAQLEKASSIDVSPKETQRLVSDKDLQGSGHAGKFVKNSNASMKMPLKRSVGLENVQNDKDTRYAKDPYPLGGPPTKKGKFDASAKNSEDSNNNENMKDKASPSEVQNSPRLEAHNNMTKSKLIKGGSKENSNVKVDKPPRNNVPPSSCKDGGGKVESGTFEVTRRPIIEKSNWMKLNWEDKMKNAHDQGRLLLFQNLDPTFTSEEVQDIIWCAFNEPCTAKMVQHTAISNPYSGQAFVILKTRETVDKVLKKLDDECLMLPNKRPLIARSVDFPKFLEKQTTFVGHLAIDKARRQIQREMKEAVATSHYSQNNTIEYEMAMSWCHLQLKSDAWWKALYGQQRKEVGKLTSNLKSK